MLFPKILRKNTKYFFLTTQEANKNFSLLIYLLKKKIKIKKDGKKKKKTSYK